MQKLHFSIHINAPREKVWNTMLDDATYRQWTKPFNPTSFYEGSWEQGSEIKFLGTNDKGVVDGGMYRRIAENRRYEFISIESLGMISAGGVIDTTSDMVKGWIGSHENYSFADKDGGTEVSVDIDVADVMKNEFNTMWPKALQILKELAE